MPLPFTLVCEPPRFLSRTLRVCGLVGGLALVAVSAFLFHFFFGPPAGAGPEVRGATLRVASKPPGVTVEIDGRARGQTPLTLAIALSEYRATLRRPGYAEATYSVRLQAGQSATLAGELWLRSHEVRWLRPASPARRSPAPPFSTTAGSPWPSPYRPGTSASSGSSIAGTARSGWARPRPG